MAPSYTLTSFTPGEAEKVTGLSTVMQRDWRRRGFLPASADGPARYDAFCLAEMWTLKMLSDRGIGPQEGKEIAEWCARGIVFYALQWRESYEGDHLAFHQWRVDRVPPAEIKRRKKELQKILDQLGQSGDGAARDTIQRSIAIDEQFPFWGDTARVMASNILKQHAGGAVIPARFFIWWADGQHIWDRSLDHAFDDMISDDPRCAGPVVILDLHALGSTMLERAARPIVHVEFELSDKGRTE